MASKYREDEINQLANQLANRSFEYNQEEDPLYQAYAKQYTEQGNRAMKDTLAQVSSRTGGLASSYAVGAAQDSYNNYMNQLNNKATDLYQLALSRYNNETNNLQNQLSIYQTLGNTEYNREQDALANQKYLDELAYSRQRDSISDQRYADETAYNRNQDALNWAYKNNQLAKENASDEQSRLLALYQATGNPSDLANYYKALGVTDIDTAMNNAGYKNTLLSEANFNYYKDDDSPSLRKYATYQDYLKGESGNQYSAIQNETSVDYQTVNEKMSSAYTEALKEYKDKKNGDGTYPNEFYAYIENAGLGAGATQEQIDKWMESRGL